MKLESRQDYWESDSTFHPALQPQEEEPAKPKAPIDLGISWNTGNPGNTQNPGNPDDSEDFDLVDEEEVDEELEDDFDAPSTAPKGFTTFIWALVAIIALLTTAAISFLLVK